MPQPAPQWALDHLTAHLNQGNEVLNVALVGRNLVLAHTRHGSVVIRRSWFSGVNHYTLGYPTSIRYADAASDLHQAASRVKLPPVSTEGDWENARPPARAASASTSITVESASASTMEVDDEEDDGTDGEASTSSTPTDGFYHDGPYTLYSRSSSTGKPQYFFAKGTPKAGTPSALPAGYLVGRNGKTGLPYLSTDPDYVPAQETPTRRDSTKRYSGDVHKVIDIEGIGKVLAGRLNAVGVTDTDELGRCDPAELATALDLGQATIELWQAMAELMKVNGIGKQYAEVLAYAGLHGIDDLKNRSPAGIARAVNTYVDGQRNKPIGTSLTAKRVEGWQATARKMRKSATTLVHPVAPAPAAAATPAPAVSVSIKAPSTGKTHGDLAGLDPMRGDVSVQWDTAPQMVAERSHKAAAPEAPTVLGGKGNEVKVGFEHRRVEPTSASPAGATTVVPASTSPAAPVTPRAAPSLLNMPEGAEVNLAGRRNAPAPAQVHMKEKAATGTATHAPATPAEPIKAVDGSTVEFAKPKGGVVKQL